MKSKSNPVFRDKKFLTEHISSIMDFYHPHCIDKEFGGFFHHFRDDGSIYDTSSRHLVRALALSLIIQWPQFISIMMNILKLLVME